MDEDFFPWNNIENFDSIIRIFNRMQIFKTIFYF